MKILVLILFVSFFAPAAFATSDSSGFLLGGLSSFFGFVVHAVGGVLFMLFTSTFSPAWSFFVPVPGVCFWFCVFVSYQEFCFSS